MEKLKVSERSGIKSIKLKLKVESYKWFFAGIYVKLIVFGFALNGFLISYFPKLTLCSSVFAEKVCDPIGNFVIAIASLPGYLYTAKILSLWKNTSPLISFLILFAVSFILYAALGLFIESQRGKKLTPTRIIAYLTLGAVIIFGTVLLLLI